MNNAPHGLPYDDLHAIAEDADTRAEIDALHAELTKATPSVDAINAHVEGFRERPKVFAVISNWFDDPRTQTFLADLAGTGL
jgi:hypothetical protein